MTRLIEIRNPITLHHVFEGGQVLKVPRNVKAATEGVLKRHDVINVVTRRTVKVDMLYLLLKSGERSIDNPCLTRRYIVSITLWVGIPPSALGLRMTLSVSRLPSLGALVSPSSKLWILLPHALFDGAPSRFIFLTPLHGAYVSAFAASTIAGLPVGDMPVHTRLAIKELSEPARLSFGSRYNFLHDGMVSRNDNESNDAFNFKLEAA